jgi:hypothetical protein
MLVAVPDNGIFGSSPVGWSAAIAWRERRHAVKQGDGFRKGSTHHLIE